MSQVQVLFFSDHSMACPFSERATSVSTSEVIFFRSTTALTSFRVLNGQVNTATLNSRFCGARIPLMFIVRSALPSRLVLNRVTRSLPHLEFLIAARRRLPLIYLPSGKG